MAEKDDSEKIIGKLIKQRKAENEAFLKLLDAMESKSTLPEETDAESRSKSRKKPAK